MLNLQELQTLKTEIKRNFKIIILITMDIVLLGQRKKIILVEIMLPQIQKVV